MNSIQALADTLELELPEIITKIAIQYKIQPFIDNPDFFEKRLEKWHQFGLLSHTRKVRQVFLNELSSLLRIWNIYEKAESVLFQEIDGTKKKILLELSIILHDLGKIVVYGDTRTNREHEAASVQLIYQDFLDKKLTSLGLTAKQIEYIAKCIETHDVLGKQLRDELKHKDSLKLSFLSKPEVIEMCRALAEKYPDLKVEIGIYFLCDSLGKTDIRIAVSTDEELQQQELKIISTLSQRNLSPELKHAVMQLPSNLKLAQVYLNNILS